jgi:PAS domain S-box-containing protein
MSTASPSIEIGGVIEAPDLLGNGFPKIDVAERRALEAVRRSQRDLEDFFENRVIGLHWVASDGTILRANQAELDLLGYTREEYVGRHIANFHADRAIIDDILARLSGGEKLDKFPARLRAKDGSIKHVQISSNGHFETGALVHARCFTVDVTAQQQAEAALRASEERYRALFASTPMAVFVCDRNGVIQDYNSHAVELWRRQPVRGVERHCGSIKLWLSDGTPLPHPQSPIGEVLRTGFPAHNVEVFIERPDGSRLPVLVNFAPLMNSEGEVTGAITSFMDITERKRAEATQQLLMDELNHRVKNTLATVQSIAAQLLKGTSDVELREAFDGRLVALSRTHDLLTRDSWEGVSLRDLLLQEFEPFWSEERTRFVVHGPDLGLNPKAALTLGMAFHELTTNAAKYGALSKPGGEVRVTWEILRASGPSALRLKWMETGGPPVKKREHKGFGSSLIERGVPLELEGEVRVEFNPSGLICTMEIPLAAAGRGDET